MSQGWPRLGVNWSTFGTGYDGGSSGSDSESPHEPLGEKAPFPLRTALGPAPPQPSLLGLPGPCLPDFWLLVRVLQDRVDVYAHARWVQKPRPVAQHYCEPLFPAAPTSFPSDAQECLPGAVTRILITFPLPPRTVHFLSPVSPSHLLPPTSPFPVGQTVGL